MTLQIKVGVIGVGSMGRHHARIYAGMDETELIGVCDADPVQAEAIAEEYETTVRDWAELRDQADAVSIAVPTEYHYKFVKDAIDHDLPVLVEKPFVKNVDRGRELVRLADERDVPIQVGHVERFNPAVEALSEHVADHEMIAVAARRLNPPLQRDIDDGAVFDLMIHDLDILLSLVDDEVSAVSSMTNADGRYATAEVKFEDGTIGQLTASRVSQRRVRELTVTADECLYQVDYDAQSMEIHRQRSTDEQTTQEKVVEELDVPDDEPLQNELRDFVDVVENGGRPTVSARDGLRVVALGSRIDPPTQPAAPRGDA